MNDIRMAINTLKLANELSGIDKSEIDYMDNSHLYKANLTAIITLEKQLNNGWIPVSERLPKREGSYLVSVERTLCNRLEHMTETILYNGDGYWHLFSGRVIAWQPLPEPYKEVEE